MNMKIWNLEQRMVLRRGTILWEMFYELSDIKIIGVISN